MEGPIYTHYNGVAMGRPPFSRRLVRHNGWWGCPEWVVRAPFCAPDYADLIVESEKVGRLVKKVAAAWPGVAAELQPARFHGEDRKVAVIPVGAAAGFAVDPDFLHYTAAVAAVSEWRWVPGIGIHENPNVGVLAGARGVDEGCGLVAIIAPISRCSFPDEGGEG